MHWFNDLHRSRMSLLHYEVAAQREVVPEPEAGYIKARSAFQRELTILTSTISILEVHNYKCYKSIPENISLSVTCNLYHISPIYNDSKMYALSKTFYDIS